MRVETLSLELTVTRGSVGDPARVCSERAPLSRSTPNQRRVARPRASPARALDRERFAPPPDGARSTGRARRWNE